MGFAFNRSVWAEIRSCAKKFCQYDDYNWDFSFRYISQQCTPNILLTMAVERSRVFHIGEWLVLVFYKIYYSMKFLFEEKNQCNLMDDEIIFQWHAYKTKQL